MSPLSTPFQMCGLRRYKADSNRRIKARPNKGRRNKRIESRAGIGIITLNGGEWCLIGSANTYPAIFLIPHIIFNTTPKILVCPTRKP